MHIAVRGVFTRLSNIKDGAFYENSYQLSAVNLSSQKAPSYMLTIFLVRLWLLQETQRKKLPSFSEFDEQ